MLVLAPFDALRTYPQSDLEVKPRMQEQVYLGTLLGAVGQHLRAALDMAVNTSPFLGDDLRAQIMSL
jgi:hypothetical protein